MSALSREEVLEVLRDAAVRVLGVDRATVTVDTRLVDDLRVDSLALVEIVEILEERLGEVRAGFHIDDADLDDVETVGQAVDLAMARL